MTNAYKQSHGLQFPNLDKAIQNSHQLLDTWHFVLMHVTPMACNDNFIYERYLVKK